MAEIKVGIIMGSDSDLPMMKDAALALEELGVEYEMVVSSAHRHPEKTAEYARSAEERGLQVIIAGAGGAAHLPGVIASMTYLPVIGVPVYTRSAGGIDSLYSIVQMPRGIPVATVAVDGAYNAGLLAAQILSLNDEKIKSSLTEYRRKLAAGVEAKDNRLQEVGFREYLQTK